MNKFNCKRIIGLFIFALIVMSFCVKNVYAANTCGNEKCDDLKKKFDQNDYQSERYGMEIAYDGEDDRDQYNISLAIKDAEFKKLQGCDSKFTKGKIEFKVTGLYLYEPVESDNENLKDLKDSNGNITFAGTDDISDRISNFSSTTISNGKTISIPRSVVNTNSEKPGVAVKLEPTFEDPELKKSCGNGKFFVVVYVYVDASTDEQDSQEEEQTPEYTGSADWQNVGPVDCDNYETKYNKDSFNYKFCEDKTNAFKLSTTRKFTIREYKKGNVIKYENNDDKKVVNPNDPLPFKCDYNKYKLKSDDNGNVADADYYINRKYLYGEGTITVNEGTYQYHGEYSKTGLNLNATCKLKCEEVVKVEYGPPVASKAGLCFEYKVKVTSRVNCEMKEKPTPPPKQVVCTPTPYCYHPGGYVSPQGGPDEDFDSCVVGCDGGVYSDKCVNKCYKEVYGESIVRTTTGTEVAYNDKIAAADGSKVNEYKIITSDGKSKIIWENYKRGKTRRSDKFYGGTKQDATKGKVASDSFWHKTRKWGRKESYYRLYSSTGIPQRGDCTGKCSWKYKKTAACKDAKNARYLNAPGVYSNPATQSDYRVDADKNKDIYDNLVKRCSAYASCNTTTSEFTISVDYTEKGKTTKQTVHFPYTENNDKNSKDTITNKDTSASCPTDMNSVILSSDGCYNCSSVKEKRLYMAEWSFPGTWIHNKTGKISYKPVSTGAWRKIKEKFCLPLNVANTNAKWYNYYQAQINGSDTSYTYNNPDYITNIQCPDGTEVKNVCEYKNTQFSSDDEKEIDYNINASTRKFGMYEWDIDISCFYAVNDLFPKVKETDNCSLLTCSSEKYRIRSVDLGNLFPAKEGEEATRNPGFNWTSFASQTAKDANYKSTPSNYATWIQAKGTDVYSDNYLDYEVNLTKEDISNIKKTVNGVLNKNYTDWQGETEVNSVVNYKSTLIRQTLTNTKYPGDEALKCNNIGDHTPAKNYSARCEEFSNKEGK